MEQEHQFIDYIEQSIIKNWDKDALTDYKGITLQYKDVARKIAKFHIVLESAGIQPGDKIAVCGRNSAHWAVTFLATITYGAVIVPILHEFNKYIEAGKDLEGKGYDPRKLLKPGAEAIQATVKEKMELFGSVGKAE